MWCTWWPAYERLKIFWFQALKLCCSFEGFWDLGFNNKVLFPDFTSGGTCSCRSFSVLILHWANICISAFFRFLAFGLFSTIPNLPVHVPWHMSIQAPLGCIPRSAIPESCSRFSCHCKILFQVVYQFIFPTGNWKFLLLYVLLYLYCHTNISGYKTVSVIFISIFLFVCVIHVWLTILPLHLWVDVFRSRASWAWPPGRLGGGQHSCLGGCPLLAA